ncbi:MAG TPA: N-acetyl-gamma-glutamyl-phosphate reductase, partial [Dehalococcoidia bacterium]|nr:N-acetyl-gamma-glutamyl-phosphate reductase [Dehalococcoidia bacterium]
YLRPKPGVRGDAIAGVYHEFAARNPFVDMTAAPPPTKQTTGTNRALVHAGMQGGTAVVTVAIDNLVKGAAGQAVQAFNIRFGFDEEAGLGTAPLWP